MKIGDVETSPYMQMGIAALKYAYYVSSRQPGLTMAQEHGSKKNGDRKNELFHNCSFYLMFIFRRSITDPFTRIFHKWIC